MKGIPEIMTKMSTLLKENGHSCSLIITRKHDYEFIWCLQDVCPETIKEKQVVRVLEEHRKLKEEGHTCLMMTKEYPPSLVWCKEQGRCDGVGAYRKKK